MPERSTPQSRTVRSLNEPLNGSADSPIRKFFITDSIETQPVALPESVEVVSVAPLFGEAIRRIHTKESISVLFE